MIFEKINILLQEEKETYLELLLEYRDLYSIKYYYLLLLVEFLNKVLH